MTRARVTPIDRPMPGRRPLDGSRAIARIMRAGKIDRRTAPAKALDRVVGVLADDWGGLDAMTGAARLLVDRIAPLTVRLILRERRLMAEAAAGIDDPSSDKGTIALHNAFSRSLARLEEMRLAAGAQKERVPSLAEYLATHPAPEPQDAPDAEDDTEPATPAAAAAAAASGSDENEEDRPQ